MTHYVSVALMVAALALATSQADTMYYQPSSKQLSAELLENAISYNSETWELTPEGARYAIVHAFMNASKGIQDIEDPSQIEVGAPLRVCSLVRTEGLLRYLDPHLRRRVKMTLQHELVRIGSHSARYQAWLDQNSGSVEIALDSRILLAERQALQPYQDHYLVPLYIENNLYDYVKVHAVMAYPNPSYGVPFQRLHVEGPLTTPERVQQLVGEGVEPMLCALQHTLVARSAEITSNVAVETDISMSYAWIIGSVAINAFSEEAYRLVAPSGESVNPVQQPVFPFVQAEPLESLQVTVRTVVVPLHVQHIEPPGSLQATSQP